MMLVSVFAIDIDRVDLVPDSCMFTLSVFLELNSQTFQKSDKLVIACSKIKIESNMVKYIDKCRYNVQ